MRFKILFSVHVLLCFLFVQLTETSKEKDIEDLDDTNVEDFIHLRQKRLIGGRAEKSVEWPWFALVQMKSKLSGSSLCGGTLLNSRWVITAASCVRRAVLNPGWVSVKLGEKDLSGSAADSTKDVIGKITGKKSLKKYDIKASKIILHNKYKNNPRLYDMALVKLTSAIPADAGLAKRIAPAVLPSDELTENYWPPDGADCLIIAWGCTKEDSWEASEVAHEVHLPKMPPSSCGIVNPKIAEFKICAGNSSTVALCAGDAGSPMMCRSDDQWVMAGLVTLKPDQHTQMSPFTLLRITRFVNAIANSISRN